MTVRAFFPGFVMLFLTSAFSLASGPPPPDPNALLRNVRQQQASQQGSLNAQLRDKGNSTPFQIIWEGDTIRYQFFNPDQALILKLGNKTAELWERQGNQTAAITPSRFDQRVCGTSVTYEDLAFQFLYWPHPTIVGEDNLRTRLAWIIQLKSPNKASRYGMVRIWIDKESGALLRMEGFDSRGRSLKRFEVISVQKADGHWLLKEMRIEERTPSSGHIIDRTYLSVKPVTKNL